MSYQILGAVQKLCRLKREVQGFRECLLKITLGEGRGGQESIKTVSQGKI